MFGEWVGTYYQNHLHAGLELPQVPALKISPNHMVQEGISRAGFVVAPPNSEIYYLLLPAAWRTIQHYGVDIDLRYDADILNDFRDRPSPYGGKYAKKWPFKYDPRDRSVIYFLDPATGAWHTILWSGAASGPRPFSDKTLTYAKSLVLARHLDPTSERDLEKVLNNLLDRIDSRQTEGAKERRIAALQAVRTENAAKDRDMMSNRASPWQVASATPETEEDTDALGKQEDRTPGEDRVQGASAARALEDNDDDDFII
jgi:hypothetical protein